MALSPRQKIARARPGRSGRAQRCRRALANTRSSSLNPIKSTLPPSGAAIKEPGQSGADSFSMAVCALVRHDLVGSSFGPAWVAQW